MYYKNTTNPILSNYNLTSNGGCTIWNTNLSIPCNTTDTTPTITLDTDEQALCRISASNHNYTTMGATRDCSTTNATSHICSLAASDAFEAGTTNLYASCEDLSGNQATTSSSGILKVHINTTITLKDINTGTTITTFNITFSNGTTIQVTTGNYTITKNHTTQNITFTATNYQPRTYQNWHTSNDLNAQIGLNTNMLTITVYDPNQILLTGTTIQINNEPITGNNPYTENIWNRLNNHTDTETINVTVTHPNYATTTTSITYNATNYTHNISLVSNQLTLNFEQNGNPKNVTWYIMGTNNTDNAYISQCGYSTILNINQSTLAINSKTLIALSTETPTTNCNETVINIYNHTQYYEYINEFGTINETIEILNQDRPAYYYYIRAVEHSNTAIPNVVVRCHYIYNYVIFNWVTLAFHGQRLTQTDGETFFNGEEGMGVTCDLTKNGYTPERIKFNINDKNRDADDPIIVSMKANITIHTTTNYTSMQLSTDFEACPPGCEQGCFYNRSATINGSLTTLLSSNPSINTQYRLDLNQPNISLAGTQNSFKNYQFQLIPTTHFSQVGNDNITLYVYMGNDLWGSREICYIAEDRQNIFNLDLTNVNDRTISIMIILAILVITATMSILFKNENIGTATFIIASIVAVFINTNFLWMAVIGTIYLIAKGAKKFISE